MHFSRIASFEDCAERTSLVQYSASGYRQEAQAAGIVHAVCMGLEESTPAGFPDALAGTPMQADLAAHLPDDVSLCLGINPYTLNEHSLAEMEAKVAKGGVVGLKIYAGYYPLDITDQLYAPAYRFAEKHDLTVVIHTGDTYSDRALLKYAHPLCVDKLAVEHRQLRMVACHMGVPWVFDACEVASKNANVYIDLSGMLVGSASYIEKTRGKKLLLDRYRQALLYMDSYDKVLVGTDWPLAPMAAYVDFCKDLVPSDVYDMVFYQNAVRVFKLFEGL